MEDLDYIYNGLGYITYSLCMADGVVQDTERREIEKLIRQAAEKYRFHVSFADGIFSLTQMERLPQTTALHLGIDEFEKHSYHLKPKLKENIISFLTDIAEANYPVTEVEESVISKVRECFARLN